MYISLGGHFLTHHMWVTGHPLFSQRLWHRVSCFCPIYFAHNYCARIFQGLLLEFFFCYISQKCLTIFFITCHLWFFSKCLAIYLGQCSEVIKITLELNKKSGGRIKRSEFYMLGKLCCSLRLFVELEVICSQWLLCSRNQVFLFPTT